MKSSEPEVSTPSAQPATPSPAAQASAGRVRHLLWLLVVLLALGVGAAAGYRAAALYLDQDRAAISKEQLTALRASVAQREAEIRFLRAQLDSSDGEIAVERAARKELETQLLGQQTELGRVGDQLAFYEQLLPPGQKGALDIRGAEFSRQGPGLRYRVLLMRNGADSGGFVGSLQFMATGSQRGKPVTLELQPLQVRADGSVAPSTDAGKEMLRLNFDQYVRSQGVLAVPGGFVPESVTIRVLDGDTVRATRNVELEF